MNTNQKLILGGIVALVALGAFAVYLSYKNKQAELEAQQNDPQVNQQPFTYQDLILGGGKALLDWLKKPKQPAKITNDVPGANYVKPGYDWTSNGTETGGTAYA